MELGTRVFVPHERLVWAPATVLSVDADGKRYRVRLDAIDPQPNGSHNSNLRTYDDVGDEREFDLRDDNMPESLPLQNAPPPPQTPATRRTLEHAAITSGLLAGARAGVDDMCELSHLHEPAIVYNVRARFFAQAPYTYTGEIVVAVNPYTWIPSLYSDALRDLYTQHAWSDLPPHVYATSAAAFQRMVTRKAPQSILVSGESGAGKTETVKILMEHLASIALANAARVQRPPSSVVPRVLKSNPLLEAFGNAKTIRNDNSSRFGKFITLQFDRDACLVGAECRHYLLEKSRVVAQAKSERNYHIFYQLVAAKEPVYGFVAAESPQSFRYLQHEEDADEELTLVVDRHSDAERYHVTRDALTTIGLSDAEQHELFATLCGILRLGQLAFVSLEADGGASHRTGNSNSNSSDASQPMAALPLESDGAVQQQRQEIGLCATLLGVDAVVLAQQLCRRSVKARQEVYCVPLSPVQASNNRDALAKELYARAFAYLVRRVNVSIADASSSKAAAVESMHIDLLDIFGFESFEKNSFEQFCINFANEKLQQKFTTDVFASVQDEYEREGLAHWRFVAYQDNQDVLDLLESPMGLLALLNEECVMPQGSDVSFASKIVAVHESHVRLTKAKARYSNTHFVIHHYAGSVTYDASGFVEKNKDALQSDLLELFATSSNALIALMFGANAHSAFRTDADLAAAHAAAMGGNDLDDREADDLRTSSSSRFSSRESVGNRRRTSIANRKTSSFMQETVSYKFKAQLALLMSDIARTQVHYVRCIKPNAMKRSDVYDMEAVVTQLRCAGVVEAIRITRAAFPNKMRHETFLRRFVVMTQQSTTSSNAGSLRETTTVAEAVEKMATQLLAGSAFEMRPTTAAAAASTLASTADDDSSSLTPVAPVVVGHSLIYFAKDVLEFIERSRTLFVFDRAVVIQRSVRRYRARCRMHVLRRAVVAIQAAHRRRIARQRFVALRSQLIRIQSVWRGVRTRQRTAFVRAHCSAATIQAAFRRWRAQSQFATLRSAVVRVQAQAKMKKQVGKYHALLSAKHEQAVMETEVDALKRRLDEEKHARLEMEAQNSTLQQALDHVRVSSVAANVSAYDNDDDKLLSLDAADSRTRRLWPHECASMNGTTDDAKLLDDSERMLEYLRQQVTKSREHVQQLSLENEVLKTENKRVKDAYTAAGASFAALNQHNKQQSKANLRLMSTHAALIKSQEEKMKKYQKQVADLQDDLRMQRNVYSAELLARVQQQDALLDLLRVAEAHNAPDVVLERMRTMVLDVQPPGTSSSSTGGSQGQRSMHPVRVTRANSSSGGGNDGVANRTGRSDTIASTGPVPVSVGNSLDPNNSSYGSVSAAVPPVRMERRSTIDAILNNPTRHAYNAGDHHSSYYESNNLPPPPQDTDRVSYVQSGSSRTSMYYDNDGSSSHHRKSRIGGMLKKMFKKDE